MVSVFAVVAVVEQADQRRDAERAGREHHLVVGRVRALADRIDDGAGLVELLLGQPTSRTKACRCLTSDASPRESAVRAQRDLGEHRRRDLVRTFDDHGFLPLHSLARI